MSDVLICNNHVNVWYINFSYSGLSVLVVACREIDLLFYSAFVLSL